MSAQDIYFVNNFANKAANACKLADNFIFSLILNLLKAVSNLPKFIHQADINY